MTEPAIRCRGLSKCFGTTAVVCGVDLQVDAESVLAVVGPSGCGKTTLLRLIAGFEAPEDGAIEVGGATVVGPGVFLPAEHRRVGMVFQDYALFPHLDVRHNVAFGLPRGAARRQRIDEMLALVGLSGRASSLPHELSGGEQQRVALARALAPHPEVLLLDEPFSNLDAGLRKQVRSELKDILRRAGATAVFVTHDQDEAFFLGDQVAVMNAGRIEQVGAPETVFHQPATPFVACFLGVADFLPGRVERRRLRTPLGELAVSDAAADGRELHLLLRPDDMTLTAASPGNGTIADRIFRGTHYLYRVRLASGTEVHVLAHHTICHPPGSSVRVEIAARHPLVAFADGRVIEVQGQEVVSGAAGDP